MKKVVVLGLLIFAVAIVYLTVVPVQAQCEVCLEFDGQIVCRRGAGPTQAAAIQAAHESTCGGNAIGMSESIACRNQVPVSVECDEE